MNSTPANSNACLSTARVAYEAGVIRLWREKRGEVEPEDLSGNLIVQLGVVTEPPSRHWYERAKMRRGYFRLACRGFRSRM
jgi:hypothetical protein